MDPGHWTEPPRHAEGGGPLKLETGSRVGVVGGGPAGSFFAHFLLEFAERVGLDLKVDLYEPRDFSHPGPAGCNMCGGIASESLVQLLATEGIQLPESVVQRGIDSYVLHMDVGQVRIETPLHEKRIAAVHRGGGPRGLKEARWESFDGHLQKLALQKGIHHIAERVDGFDFVDGRPQLQTRHGEPRLYDLVAVAIGVNSSAHKLFQRPESLYQPPRTVTALLREYYLGEETIEKFLGSAMHVFLLNLPGLEFAAMIPKGDYVSMCLLGDAIDRDLFQRFLNSPEVRECMPPEWEPEQFACRCSPHMNVEGSPRPFSDRLVFIGDSGVTRLYKDGIGSAYRTAKAAARTAVFEGVSAEDFESHYAPTCRAIAHDNGIGRAVFRVTREIQKRRFSRGAVFRMVAREQHKEGSRRRMSTVLWDIFTGSAPYREILGRTLHPAFLGQLLWNHALFATGLAGRPSAGVEDR